MQIKIDGKKVNVKENQTILEAAEKAGIDIPTLCYDSELKTHSNCRMCVVEVDNKLITSCDNPIKKGMNIKTKSKKVLNARKLNIELLLARNNEPDERNKLLELKKKYNVKPRFRQEKIQDIDKSSLSIRIDSSKCILCEKCVAKCNKIQSVDAICFENRSIKMKVKPAFEKKLNDSVCVDCGQCSLVCPTGAIKEVDEIDKVKKLLKNKKKHVVVQTAPSVRATIGEEFGMPAGSLVTGKLVTALRKLGFDKIFDTNFGADLTIMEEADELIYRIKNKGTLPMITSCCPGWIKFMETFYPDLIKHISTCKSPHQMFGVIAKTYYAKKQNINPKDIAVVSIMPCTAKKFECQRPEMRDSGYQDVDVVITTRETARMMKEFNINLSKLGNEQFDAPLGISTGAGLIFGATGGVMEAALRTASEIITKKPLKKLDFNEVRGLKGIKESTLKMAKLRINVAVAHGLRNARKLLDKIRQGKSKYHFIEIMACPGGCLGGGGQPIPTNDKIRLKRAKAIYNGDKKLSIRKSHENPAIKQLYREFLGRPNSHKAHKLLHTKYIRRGE